MPVDRTRGKKKQGSIKRTFVDRIRSGSVTPIISSDAMVDLVLGGRRKLVERYADYLEYPLEDRDNRFKMAKFKSISDELDDWELKSDYLNFVKQHLYELGQDEDLDEDVLEAVADEDDAKNLTVTEFADRLGYPIFATDQNDPLLVLANLRLSIYLTTSPFGFLEVALRKAGTEPQSDFARWHTGLDSVPSVFDEEYEPSPDTPLVYHLFGIDERPDSLILTEDDHLRYLVAVSQGNGIGTDPIPSRIRQSLSDAALILLGFGLPSWSFRILYWGLIEPAPRNSKGIFSLQLEPSEVEKRYLQEYLKREALLDIFWGDIHSYTHELQRMLRG